MTKTKQICRCSACGNIVEVVNASTGTLSCCGKPMELLTENTTDAATEKHVPVIEKTDCGYRVTVGEVEHPMAEEHYIQWIALATREENQRKELEAGQKREAEFMLCEGDEVEAGYAYCNQHGLWKAEP